MSSRFIHAVACDRISFLFQTIIFPCMYILHVVYSSISGRFGCLHTVKNAQWTWVGERLWESIFNSFGHGDLEVGLLGHMALLFLNFWGNSIVFAIAVVPFYNCTNCAQWLRFLHILTNTSYFLFFFFFIVAILLGMRWYLIVGFDLHISVNYWYQTSFHMLVAHLRIVTEELSIQGLWPLFNQVIYLIFMYFGY